MTSHSEDLVSIDELRSVLSVYAGPDTPRERSTRKRTKRLRPLLVAAVVFAACTAAGLAIAASLGAFDGISAAQHPRTHADKLDPKTRAQLRDACPRGSRASFYMPFCHLVLDSTRRIGHIALLGSVYVITDTRGDLCTVWEAGASSCGPPLSKSQPISFGTFNRAPTAGSTFVATGLAIDGVTSVSFRVGGKAVAAPVTDNVWVYEEPDSHATTGSCIVAHLANGSTVIPFPEVPCP
jgi:hypothetical protein